MPFALSVAQRSRRVWAQPFILRLHSLRFLRSARTANLMALTLLSKQRDLLALHVVAGNDVELSDVVVGAEHARLCEEAREHAQAAGAVIRLGHPVKFLS